MSDHLRLTRPGGAITLVFLCEKCGQKQALAVDVCVCQPAQIYGILEPEKLV